MHLLEVDQARGPHVLDRVDIHMHHRALARGQGAPADLVVFDADYAWKVDRDELWSKTKNTPFDERPVQGRVMATIVGGRTIYRDDSFATAAAAA